VSATYILPLRRDVAEAPAGDLARYLQGLSQTVRVLIVDGSSAHIRAVHRAVFGEAVTVIAPDERDRCLNGKAWGVLTGLRHAGEMVVIADDDVRWDEKGLQRALAMLAEADLVLPQNHFDPLPWHAVWDTGRTLLNRAAWHDWPGTVALRRAALPGQPAYDGDVLFENCEMVRTVRASGGRVEVALDLFVARRPPTVRHFIEQRPRQAYDDLAQPLRWALLLGLAPVVAAGGLRVAMALGVASIALAEVGRRRAGGRRVFPWYTSVLSPLWVSERAAMSWWVAWRALSRRGVTYSGGRIRSAATPQRRLRDRHAGT
jgi:hypothetical protein